MTGRAVFLEALRRRWPTLWRKLHTEVWQASPPADLRAWAAGQGLGIVDGWLLDALSQTLLYWTFAPETPDAKLQDGHRWIFYFPNGTVPDFQPKIENPYPTYRGPENYVESLLKDTTHKGIKAGVSEYTFESLEDFQARIMRQVREQLIDYTRQIRESFLYDTRPQLAVHAEWTALVLASAPIAEITRAPEWERNFRKGEPESTVGKAVSRFAAHIGLTLPRRLTLADSLAVPHKKQA